MITNSTSRRCSSFWALHSRCRVSRTPRHAQISSQPAAIEIAPRPENIHSVAKSRKHRTCSCSSFAAHFYGERKIPSILEALASRVVSECCAAARTLQLTRCENMQIILIPPFSSCLCLPPLLLSLRLLLVELQSFPFELSSEVWSSVKGEIPSSSSPRHRNKNLDKMMNKHTSSVFAMLLHDFSHVAEVRVIKRIIRIITRMRMRMGVVWSLIYAFECQHGRGEGSRERVEMKMNTQHQDTTKPTMIYIHFMYEWFVYFIAFLLSIALVSDCCCSFL